MRYDAAERAEVSKWPEPYRSAARLVPGDGWRFVKLAALHQFARDPARTPAERAEVARDMRRILEDLMQRRAGRPTLAESPELLAHLKWLYQEIRALLAAGIPDTAALRGRIAALGVNPSRLNDNVLARAIQGKKQRGKKQRGGESLRDVSLAILASVVAINPSRLSRRLFRREVKARRRLPLPQLDLVASWRPGSPASITHWDA
jgi:hypothetical protein